MDYGMYYYYILNINLQIEYDIMKVDPDAQNLQIVKISLHL